MDVEHKLAALGPEKTPDFCVRIDFQKGMRNPQRLLKSAAAYIDALNSLDSLLVSSIDAKIKPVFVLEEIEHGSIKLWLKQALEAIDDDALKNIDWRPAVGKYLVKAKYFLLKRLEGKTAITNREEMEALTREIFDAAQATGVRKFPAYRDVSAFALAQEAKKISEALSGLEKGDSITFQADVGDSVLTPDFIITQEDITNLFAGEVISNDLTKILMVRRPDFLGDSKWEFRYERRPFSATIIDEGWLSDFHSGKIDIRPGDALRVMIRETVLYDNNGEVIKEEREILSVLGITKPAIQSSLL
ncbi:MAG: hypothetical protein LBB52_08595 [Desulfovibrio sp.]|jgi:hypothetical protein|nr:hypothetical protein [Desulfovibrio sp.]